MKRRDLLGLICIAAAGWPVTAAAQQSSKVHLILWVSTEAQPDSARN
jgi:hypothetical protein